MEIEDQVCSLELAKRLKELGADQESSYFVYIYDEETNNRHISRRLDSWSFRQYAIIATFTTAELGEMLPDHYYSFKESGKWIVGAILQLTILHIPLPFISCTTEADARARILIHILENKVDNLNHKG